MGRKKKKNKNNILKNNNNNQTTKKKKKKPTEPPSPRAREPTHRAALGAAAGRGAGLRAAHAGRPSAGRRQEVPRCPAAARCSRCPRRRLLCARSQPLIYRLEPVSAGGSAAPCARRARLAPAAAPVPRVPRRGGAGSAPRGGGLGGG